MKRFLHGLAAGLLLLASCAPHAGRPLPELIETSADGLRQRCEAVFPAGSWQLVHSLEFASDSGFAGTVLGVTVVDPPDLSCALVTVEGVTLFEAVGGPDEAVTVERAVPPFDRPGFAAGLLADVRSMFVAPPDREVTYGLLPDGRPVCRYIGEDGRVTDIAPPVEDSWQIREYDADSALQRVIEGYVDYQRSPSEPARYLELSAFLPAEYTLKMKLIDALHVP
jgi:hypothetical protein